MRQISNIIYIRWAEYTIRPPASTDVFVKLRVSLRDVYVYFFLIDIVCWLSLNWHAPHCVYGILEQHFFFTGCVDEIITLNGCAHWVNTKEIVGWIASTKYYEMLSLSAECMVNLMSIVSLCLLLNKIFGACNITI